MFDPMVLIEYPQIDPVWFTIPTPFDGVGLPIRWYSLSYIAGIVFGWWYVARLAMQPGSPMAKRHVDDLVTWATIGVILGGRLAYVLFYDSGRFFGPEGSLGNIVRVWEGGMSFHGGAIGVILAIFFYCRSQGLNWVRVGDYVCCAVPAGLFFGRLANFINGELYGRPTDLPWAMIFPSDPLQTPRHPSQLYEAALEGLVLFTIMAVLFWRTRARYQPGFLAGTFLLGYGSFRFLVEFVRMPDAQLGVLGWGLTMGQTLCLPMIIAGLYLILTAKARRERIDPIAGTTAQQ
ncbi:prolipoprotein diacylglyceryl transferase [Pacificimonas flava]|uniref:Phosphatidylglycerol--prolipoprotein diacylglyceryl transferase n=2 Tax=Pacificimonas TaxID=1960290 RepID=A0A219B3P4_9SPHN|nr:MULTISPECIES: prolipoprotein diacylglyceryl transferase [Pacificimonas]MBZ6377893.1 prolipoprotein diacylglyceryl transferase [Pacificimonas aurantium]OWV32449.1 prolipoprotein diacylglyceryl transferase [Pacificimonas flava]